jgi:hypothetical protein
MCTTYKFKTLRKIPVISTNIHISCKKFLEFTGIIYRNWYCEYRNIYWHPSSHWGCSQTEKPKKGETNIWFLLHDNDRAHWSVLVKDFLAKNNVTTVEQPHILLTWLQLIFSCSSRLKSPLKRQCCHDATDIIKNVTIELKRPSQNGFQECFQHLYSHRQ